MAHESTQRARIVPAIPLKFRQGQQRGGQSNSSTDSKPTFETPQQHVALKSPTTATVAHAPINLPLTPESISSGSSHKAHEHAVQDAREWRELDAPSVNGPPSNPSTTDNTSQAVTNGATISGASAGTPGPDITTAHLTITSRKVHKPREIQQEIWNNLHGRGELDDGVSDGGIASVPALVKEQSQIGVESLIFGSIANDLDTSGVTFTRPRYQHQSPRNSMMANNVNAAPFFPATTGTSPDDTTNHSAVKGASADSPATKEQGYPEDMQSAQAGGRYNQPLSPSLSQQLPTRDSGSQPRMIQPHLNGHTQLRGTDTAVQDSALPGSVQADIPSGLRGGPATPSLTGYVLSQFGQLNFADCLLEFYLPSNKYVPVRLPAHRLLAAQSPRLASELVLGSPGAEFDPYGLRIVRVWAHSGHVKAEGIIEALRYLYGAPLPALMMGTPASDDRDLFSRAVDIAAAGSLLELPEFEVHGLDLMRLYMSWDVLDEVYAYLSEAGNRNRTVELHRRATDIIAREFPRDFIFDTRAPQLSHAPRLPEFSSSRPSTSDPRLSQIQFGEVVDGGLHSDRQAVASTLLVSLPFDDAKRVLEHEELRLRVGASSLVHLQQAVVDERERRRIKAQKARRRQSLMHQHQDKTLLDNLFWQEQLDHSFDGSLILSRVRIGEFDTK